SQRAPIKWNSSTNTIKVDKKLLSDNKSKTKQLASVHVAVNTTHISTYLRTRYDYKSSSQTVGPDKAGNYHFIRSLAPKSSIHPCLRPQLRRIFTRRHNIYAWLRKTSTAPLRGLGNDGEDVPEASRRTAAQKLTHLELMLGQVANYCPVIARNTIVKNSTSMSTIWQAIRAHYGFQSTGAHFLDFNNLRLQPDERPDDLYQRLLSFIDDNLLTANGNIRHHGEDVSTDEELTPSLENII
ncbi:Retrovirus-related Pol poly from transposon opus, partial [Paramuricea clavata]